SGGVGPLPVPSRTTVRPEIDTLILAVGRWSRRPTNRIGAEVLVDPSAVEHVATTSLFPGAIGTVAWNDRPAPVTATPASSSFTVRDTSVQSIRVVMSTAWLQANTSPPSVANVTIAGAADPEAVAARLGAEAGVPPDVHAPTRR